MVLLNYTHKLKHLAIDTIFHDNSTTVFTTIKAMSSLKADLHGTILSHAIILRNAYDSRKRVVGLIYTTQIVS